MLQSPYCELLGIARATVSQSHAVTEALGESPAALAPRVRQPFDELLPLVEQVIAQTERWVLKGESIPAAEKVVSLVEPHTQIICRGKAPPHDTDLVVIARKLHNRRRGSKRQAKLIFRQVYGKGVHHQA